MPRYFFDLAEHKTAPDQFGTELADDDAARADAINLITDYVRHHPELITDGDEVSVIVRKAESHVFTVRWRSHLTVAMTGPDDDGGSNRRGALIGLIVLIVLGGSVRAAERLGPRPARARAR